MKTELKLMNKLKEFRQERGITQSELAKMVGTSRNTISSIETGQFCTTDYLAAIMFADFDCDF